MFAESSEYFLDMSIVFLQRVRVDQDVIQINDDTDVNHIGEDVIHEPLKSCWRID